MAHASEKELTLVHTQGLTRGTNPMSMIAVDELSVNIHSFSGVVMCTLQRYLTCVCSMGKLLVKAMTSDSMRGSILERNTTNVRNLKEPSDVGFMFIPTENSQKGEALCL
jgi:hypothetical protein